MTVLDRHFAHFDLEGPKWLEERRAGAAAILNRRGLPNRRVEEWKYSDMKSALETPAVASPEKAADPFAGLNVLTLTLTDGKLKMGGAIPEGLDVVNLARFTNDTPDWIETYLGTSVVRLDAALPAASLVMMQGGVALRVARGVKVAMPVHLVSDITAHARVLIYLEQGASMTLLETSNGGEEFFNLGMEVFLASGAELTHIRFAREAAAVQMESVAVVAAKDAAYNAHFANFGSKLSRLDLDIVLNGTGAKANLRGVSVLGGTGHADITTRIDHAVGDTHSEQLFKKVAGGKSRAVYQGKILVREGADKADSSQTAKALLLGERAEADLKPELEIFADDVKCAHGAAVGDIDPDALFYLRARGLPEDEARAALLRAFVEDAMDTLEEGDIRDRLWSAVEAALPHAMGRAA